MNVIYEGCLKSFDVLILNSKFEIFIIIYFKVRIFKR